MLLSQTIQLSRLKFLLYAFLLLNAYRIPAQKFWLTTYSFPGGPKTAIALDPDHCLLVALTSQVIRSCDDGISWDSLLSTSFVHSLFVSKSGRIFAGGAGKIFYSDDSGIRWDSVDLNHHYPVTRLIENINGDLFAITGTLDLSLGFVGAGVYYSGDIGSTWVQRNQGLGPYLCCEQITHDQKGGLYLAVADELVSGHAGLFYSDNSGQHWQHVNIEIDGKNIIDNRIKIGNTTGLSISPDDSIHLSIAGTAVNVGVSLNLQKSIRDLMSTAQWGVRTVSNTSTWWNDRLLNNIHFAQNGDWYSSMKGSPGTGGTFFSKTKGQIWNRHVQGLGLDWFGQMGIQYFAENDSGKIYMVQLWDERIYWADTSVLKSVATDDTERIQAIFLYPNPVRAGDFIYWKKGEPFENAKLSLYDVKGNLISAQYLHEKNGFQLPKISGFYLIYLNQGAKRFGPFQCMVH